MPQNSRTGRVQRLYDRLHNIIARRAGRPLGRWYRATLFYTGLEPARPPRVFCLGMQRSGTTSFGNFCETELGLVRRGFYHSITNEWTRAWMEGKPGRIFASPDFRTGEIFEDDPWWCPGFYQRLASEFPDAKFVLLTRDETRWFRSLMAHSNGRSPGHTDLHATIYGRTKDFEALLRDSQAKGQSFKSLNWQGLSLEGQAEHYITAYRMHTQNTLEWFDKHAPDRLLHVTLEDPQKFAKVARFLGYPDKDWPDIHVNAIASSAASLTCSNGEA